MMWKNDDILDDSLWDTVLYVLEFQISKLKTDYFRSNLTQIHQNDSSRMEKKPKIIL